LAIVGRRITRGLTIVRVADVEWVGVPPLFPVTVKVAVAPGAELVVLTVMTEVPPPAMVAGLNEADAPLGRPDALSGALPVNPLRAVIVTV
jgi:hypothetical protein